ncbi:MAG: SulP family inorganic anion transporter [Comamonas sp.]
MPVTQTDSGLRLRLAGLWAGLASAAICYAEYLGLGAVLGPALLGYGDQSKSVGTLLVVLSACLSGLLLAWRRMPYLAGPRGASLSMLVLCLVGLQKLLPGTAAQQLPVLASLVLGCVCMLGLAGTRRGQQRFARLPAWLMPAFIYASAVGIVAGAAGKYLYGCLQRAPLATWGIFLGACLLGVLWNQFFQARHAAAVKAQAPQRALRAKQLQGLALIVAAAAAWLVYEASPLAASTAGQCARLGQVDLHLQVLGERMAQLWHSLGGPLPWLSLLAAWVLGLGVGAVAAIESRAALDVLQREAVKQQVSAALPSQGSALRLQAGSAAVLLPCTGVPAAYSQSRTLVLWQLGGTTAWAAGCHAVALLGVALLASQWLAWLPQLVLAVLMTLVAVQMVGDPVQRIWRAAYDAQAPSYAGLRAGLGLWLVLGITALTGQVLLSFVLPALGHGAYRLWRRRRFVRHRNSQSSERAGA